MSTDSKEEMRAALERGIQNLEKADVSEPSNDWMTKPAPGESPDEDVPSMTEEPKPEGTQGS